MITADEVREKLKKLEPYYIDLGFHFEIETKNNLHSVTISWKESESEND